MPRSRKPIRLKWKNLGFIPPGCDDSQMIKYPDKGFLYLCLLLRNDWREYVKLGFTTKDRKWRPGQGGGNGSYDWTGLREAIDKIGGEPEPPELSIRVTVRKPLPEEREHLGQTAHRNWQAVRHQQREAGEAVDDAQLRPWAELSDVDRELFRKSGEMLAVSEETMWAAVAEMRKRMGERAFRRKLFELCVSISFERMNPDWSPAERENATRRMVGLSEMLEVPPPDEIGLT
jgi:hypothetical protein